MCLCTRACTHTRTHIYIRAHARTNEHVHTHARTHRHWHWHIRHKLSHKHRLYGPVCCRYGCLSGPLIGLQEKLGGFVRFAMGGTSTGLPGRSNTKNERPHRPNIEVGGKGNDYALALRTFSKTRRGNTRLRARAPLAPVLQWGRNPGSTS